MHSVVKVLVLYLQCSIAMATPVYARATHSTKMLPTRHLGVEPVGITNFNEWAVTCPQVGMRDEQNISVVISACPENRPDLNGCNVCGGETSLGPITVRPLKVAAKTIEKCASHAWHINPL